jgi:hypothetical protein
MNCKKVLALGGAILVAVALPSATAGATGTKVTVRVEGKNKTLLAPTVIQAHSGWITKDGVKKGLCPESSGQGALDIATHHRWGGTFDSSLKEYFVKSILGETDNGPKYYWSIFVNNKSAATGACEIKLHAGDTLLFAAAVYPEYPIALNAPAKATAGTSFSVKVVRFTASGARKPLAGAKVTGNGISSATTNGAGTAQITATRSGTLKLNASHSGYIRAAPITVKVS